MKKSMIRMQVMKQMLGVAWALVALLPGMVHGTEWYVATHGNHTTGADWATAYTNIQTALNQATTGDTVYLAGETFAVTNQLVWTQSGVTVRGGYAAANAADKPGVSDPDQWPTVITRSGAFNHRIMTINGANDSLLEAVTLIGGNVDTGAGLYIASSQNVLLSGCIIEDNAFTVALNGSYNGAGLYASSSEVTLTNCIVRRNHGVNTSTSNSARTRGGGIYSDGILIIQDSRIIDNTLTSRYSTRNEGGGVYFTGTQMELKNVLLDGNTAHGGGGAGLYVGGGTVNLSNCTVADNGGEGIRQAGGSVALTNSIVAGNWKDVVGTVTAAYSHVSDTTYGGSNTSGDPLLTGGYYLAAGSPCVGTGSGTAESLDLATYTTRTDGAPYASGTTVDRGYHHFPGSSFDLPYADVYVSVDGADGHIGTGPTPAEAFRTVTKALSVAHASTRIHVAAGVYSMADGEVFPLAATDKPGLQILGTNATVTIFDAVGSGTNVVVLDYSHRVSLENLTLTHGETYNGGGLRASYSQGLRLSGCVIEDNTYSAYFTGARDGAGIYAETTHLTLTNCLVQNNIIKNGSTGNATVCRGGGIWCNGDLTITDSRILGNATYGQKQVALGGGIYFDGQSLVLRNVLLAGNSTHGGSGSGLYVKSGNAILSNCTVADNAGDGIARTGGTVFVSNSIVQGNWSDVDGTITFSHSCVGDTDFGGDNIWADPLLEYGYHLAADSPCIGTGSEPAENLGLAAYSTRTDGAAYASGATVNMGYHKLPRSVFDLTTADLWVSEDGDDTHAGTGPAPAEALRTVTKALALAQDGTRIHVAAGIYTVSGGEIFPLEIIEKRGVQVLGATSGTTTLDANGSGQSVMALTRANRTLLKDLTLTGGGTYDGAGLRIVYGQNILLSGCAIETNSFTISLKAAVRGAGICAEISDVTVTNCLVRGNIGVNTMSATAASSQGGGIWSDGQLKVYQSQIIDNTVSSYALNRGGGGVYFKRPSPQGTQSALELKNVLLAGNFAQGDKDGILIDIDAPAELINTTVVNHLGEGVVGSKGASVSLLNCIVWSNGVDVVDITTNTLTVSYSTIGTSAGSYFDGGNNISADPLFVNFFAGNYRLQPDSPAINTGLQQAWMASATDLDGRRRVSMGGVDMGCYEMPAPLGTLLIIQ